MSDDNALNFQRLQNAQLHQNLATAVSNDAMSGIAASHANQRARTLQESQANLQQQLDFHRNLLKQPMHVIAHHSPEFRKLYEEQKQLLASWLVGFRSYRETAMALGQQLGMSKEDVVAARVANLHRVLDNDTQHENNAADEAFLVPHIEALKRTMIKKA